MLCNAKFSKEVQLKKHLINDHELEKPFYCGLPFINQICTKSFKDKKSLIRHRKEFHNFTKNCGRSRGGSQHMRTRGVKNKQRFAGVLLMDGPF